MMKKIKDFESYLVLLILAYLLFFQYKVQDGLLNDVLDFFTNYLYAIYDYR